MIPRPDNLDALPPKARITIRRTSDGELRTQVEDWTGDFSATWDWTPTLGNLWWYWTQGNSSCDCNRHLLFGHPVAHDLPCHDEETGGNLYELVGFEPLP